MKKNSLNILLILSCLVWGHAAFARNDGVGVGMIIGDPTGLSLKSWLDRTHAIDAGLGWNTHHEDEFHLHVDYLIHDFSAFRVRSGRMPFYYGIGGVVAQDDYDHYHNHAYHHHDDTHLGVRIPLGISYSFASNPLELFAELAPRLDLTPGTDFMVDAAMGVRFYFK